MRRYVFLNDYTLDAIAWDRSTGTARLYLGEHVLTVNRPTAETIAIQLGYFLQDTDYEANS